MLKFARCSDWEMYQRNIDYRKVLDSFDGVFFHLLKRASAPLPIPFISYHHLLKSLDHPFISATIERMVPRVIVMNEAFLDTGKMRKTVDYELVRSIVNRFRKESPDTELWITDYKPQCLAIWRSVRAAAADLELDGIGIHCYIEQDRRFADVAENVKLAAVKGQTLANRNVVKKVSFSEVAVFPGKTDGRLAEGYNKVIGLAESLDIDWINYWCPTDSDRYHWHPKRVRDCGLFDRSYKLKPGIIL